MFSFHLHHSFIPLPVLRIHNIPTTPKHIKQTTHHITASIVLIEFESSHNRDFSIIGNRTHVVVIEVSHTFSSLITHSRFITFETLCLSNAGRG